MSGSVNKAIILGRLGRDPELRHTQNQTLCKLSVCTSRRYTDRRGDSCEEVEWHQVSVWGPMAEHCAKYLIKGREVYVEGRLRTSSYEKEGQRHYSTEIVAESVQFIGGKPDRREARRDDRRDQGDQGDQGRGGDHGGTKGKAKAKGKGESEEKDMF